MRRHFDPHGANIETRNDMRMPDRRAHVFAQKSPHPGDPVAAHDMIRVDHVLQARNGRNMSAHYDGRRRRKLPHHPAHLPNLADIHDDRRDAYDIVVILGQLFRERIARRKIEQRGRRRNVFLDQHDSPGAMKHAQRKTPLRARHLVMVKLHRIDAPAAEFIVLRVGSENRSKKNAGVCALRMSIHNYKFLLPSCARASIPQVIFVSLRSIRRFLQSRSEMARPKCVG